MRAWPTISALVCLSGCDPQPDSATVLLAWADPEVCEFEYGDAGEAFRADGAGCDCSVSGAESEWWVPADWSNCPDAAKDEVPGPCSSASANTWSRRCFIDAYLTTCCEAAAEAGCPCGGEAP